MNRRFPSIDEVVDYLQNLLNNAQPLPGETEHPYNIVYKILQLVNSGRLNEIEAKNKISELVQLVSLEHTEKNPEDQFTHLVNDFENLPMIEQARELATEIIYKKELDQVILDESII